eukprot:NODE_10560_length_1343_cov_6.041118.p9 GENE.NODE_10560_length_1343_cov_6.041118~~NODE_10560_length_1343_cov_6.041118.p9  ORF type:complete len:86 (+),score=13.47 NODE_10560_length_1343_cov_6.041118:305-562(+)
MSARAILVGIEADPAQVAALRTPMNRCSSGPPLASGVLHAQPSGSLRQAGKESSAAAPRACCVGLKEWHRAMHFDARASAEGGWE